VVAAILVGALTQRWPALTGQVAAPQLSSRTDSCLPGTAVAVQPSPRVSHTAISHARYNSTPPTSGPQFPFPIATGIYRHTLPDGLAVHALAGGHVIIHYAPTLDPAQQAALRHLAKRFPRDVLLEPYRGLPGPIALTAWARIEYLNRADTARIESFVQQLRGRYVNRWTRADGCRG
jgi:uncharacterized protein DUF3105